MARKQGDLIPVGEALADLPGPVQALRKTPPPARRGFTVADQVHQLVSASEADADLGFMARLLALCSLPRTNPGNRKEYKRVNGPYTLYGIVTLIVLSRKGRMDSLSGGRTRGFPYIECVFPKSFERESIA